jgi:hypothetical protein
VEKFCSDSCIAYVGIENDKTWVCPESASTYCMYK